MHINLKYNFNLIVKKYMAQYRIEWRYINNSNTRINNGDWSDSKKILESSIEYLNKQHTGVIIHWLATK